MRTRKNSVFGRFSPSVSKALLTLVDSDIIDSTNTMLTIIKRYLKTVLFHLKFTFVKKNGSI